MAIKPLSVKDEVEAFVSKGAPVIGKMTGKTDKDDWKMISLRLPQSLLDLVDEKKATCLGMTRNTFILKLIQDGLNYELDSRNRDASK